MKLLIASTAMALVLASSTAWAASDTLGSGRPGTNSRAVDSSQKVVQASQAMINVMPARQIVGQDLKDAQGIDAGQINSLVINTKSGAVEFVMITPPSSFNANGQLIAAPWAALNPPATAKGPMTIKVNVDKLAKAPHIDPRLIFELSRPEQRDRMYGFYGYNDPGYSKMGYDNRVAVAEKNKQNELGARDRQSDLAHQNVATTPPAANKDHPAGASALVVAEDGAIAKLEALSTTSAAARRDADVYDSNGKNVGGIDETMIDVTHGDVAYILISHGGFLGMPTVLILGMPRIRTRTKRTVHELRKPDRLTS